jgi:hypothetical protein
MKEFKYILIFLVMLALTLVINGGSKSKPTVTVNEARKLAKKTVVHGFPDMIFFANYITQ